MAFASPFDLPHEILLERKDGFSRAPVSHPQNQIRINRRKWEEKDQVCVKMSLTHQRGNFGTLWAPSAWLWWLERTSKFKSKELKNVLV